MLTISGTQFLSNTATATGGGTVGNTTFLTNTTYLNNSADSWGGGAEAFGPIQVFNSLFQNNRTQANGGGISTSSSMVVSRSRFIDNTAQGDGTYGGGAIAATLFIAATDSEFTGNTANTSPGGALVSGGGLNLTGSTFTGNSAANADGGAAYTVGPAAIVRSTFQDNGSGGDGGALFISNTLTLSGSLVINNVAHEGGGLYLATGSGQIVNTLFARNTSLDNAGMAMHLLPTGTLQILYTTVAAPALINGDAVRVDSGNVTLKDTIVTNHAIGLNRLGGNVLKTTICSLATRSISSDRFLAARTMSQVILNSSMRPATTIISVRAARRSMRARMSASIPTLMGRRGPSTQAMTLATMKP